MRVESPPQTGKPSDHTQETSFVFGRAQHAPFRCPHLSLLNSISGPRDLRSLDEQQLRRLCREIRATIIETVASTGGHLGSSLGVVELTVALHRMLDCPPTGSSGTPATRPTPTSC
jgi:sialic acid synthase SpsE